MIISWANILIPTWLWCLCGGPGGSVEVHWHWHSPCLHTWDHQWPVPWHCANTSHDTNIVTMLIPWTQSESGHNFAINNILESAVCSVHCIALHWIFTAIILSFIWTPSPGCSCIMDAMSEVRPARCRSRLSWECKLQPKPRINQCADVNTVSLMVTAYHGVSRMWWDYTRNGPHFIINGCKHGISRCSHIHGGAFSLALMQVIIEHGCKKWNGS